MKVVSAGMYWSLVLFVDVFHRLCSDPTSLENTELEKKEQAIDSSDAWPHNERERERESHRERERERTSHCFSLFVCCLVRSARIDKRRFFLVFLAAIRSCEKSL